MRPRLPVLFGKDMGMDKTIQFKRGNRDRLPPLREGEPGFCLDSGDLFVGSPGGNRLVGGFWNIDAGHADSLFDDSMTIDGGVG